MGWELVGWSRLTCFGRGADVRVRSAGRPGSAGAEERIQAGQRPVRRVRREEGAHLVLGRPAAEAREAADQLHVGQVRGGELIVTALTVDGQLLERPGADPGDPSK